MNRIAYYYAEHAENDEAMALVFKYHFALTLRNENTAKAIKKICGSSIRAQQVCSSQIFLTEVLEKVMLHYVESSNTTALTTYFDVFDNHRPEEKYKAVIGNNVELCEQHAKFEQILNRTLPNPFTSGSSVTSEVPSQRVVVEVPGPVQVVEVPGPVQVVKVPVPGPIQVFHIPVLVPVPIPVEIPVTSIDALDDAFRAGAETALMSVVQSDTATYNVNHISNLSGADQTFPSPYPYQQTYSSNNLDAWVPGEIYCKLRGAYRFKPTHWGACPFRKWISECILLMSLTFEGYALASGQDDDHLPTCLCIGNCDGSAECRIEMFFRISISEN